MCVYVCYDYNFLHYKLLFIECFRTFGVCVCLCWGQVTWLRRRITPFIIIQRAKSVTRRC